MALNVLRLILSHARGQGLVATNAVEAWKSVRPRRRSSSSVEVAPEKVLSAEELAAILRVAEADCPRFSPLVLFLADTGARLGEALALRWIDVDLEAGTARIARSFSSGRTLGPTKTGRERVVELSSRLRSVLFDRQPTMPTQRVGLKGETGHFYLGKNRTSVLCADIETRLELLSAGGAEREPVGQLSTIFVNPK